jgi:hypothetical protein
MVLHDQNGAGGTLDHVILTAPAHQRQKPAKEACRQHDNVRAMLGRRLKHLFRLPGVYCAHAHLRTALADSPEQTKQRKPYLVRVGRFQGIARPKSRVRTEIAPVHQREPGIEAFRQSNRKVDGPLGAGMPIGYEQDVIHALQAFRDPLLAGNGA